MKHTSFSNFNDPSFNAIAAKFGVDVTSLNDGIECSSFIYPDQNRSEGIVCENFSLDGSSSLDCVDPPTKPTEGLWSLICRH